MSTLHMQTEMVRSAARQMRQISEQSHAEIQMLVRAAKSLEATWRSGSSDEFLFDATEVIRRLRVQYELLMVLAERVEGEASEWEQVDRNGATAFQTSKSQFLGSLPVYISAGGSGASS